MALICIWTDWGFFLAMVNDRSLDVADGGVRSSACRLCFL